MNTITIEDDFDLYKITYSGQCFRAAMLDNGYYRFITGNKILIIRALPAAKKDFVAGSSTQYEISCSLSEWNDIWFPYFDLSTDYASVRSSIPSSDKYIHNAAKIGQGIRILNQDPFEMLICFIISQRKSIPAIKSSVEKICQRWGKTINLPQKESFYPECDNPKSFPTASDLMVATLDELADCGLGYRIPYILDAVKRVNDNRLNLCELKEYTDEDLFNKLKTVYGVGDKVANCISLFAYHRTGRAPIDTWIAKVINEEYNGINPFPKYGPNAGIMQQYVFYAAQHEKM